MAFAAERFAIKAGSRVASDALQFHGGYSLERIVHDLDVRHILGG